MSRPCPRIKGRCRRRERAELWTQAIESGSCRRICLTIEGSVGAAPLYAMQPSRGPLPWLEQSIEFIEGTAADQRHGAVRCRASSSNRIGNSDGTKTLPGHGAISSNVPSTSRNNARWGSSGGGTKLKLGMSDAVGKTSLLRRKGVVREMDPKIPDLN